MDSARNLDSAPAGVQEHEVGLKPGTNAPLDVFALIPPEIMGEIFYWAQQNDHRPSPKVPHNLLFVCHDWFEVAKRTPQLWTSWGHTLQDWELRHTCPTSSKLYLQLDGDDSSETKQDKHLSKSLRDTLQDRAKQDFIQQVSLIYIKAETLNSIISAIITPGKEVQSISLELFAVEVLCVDDGRVELSDFFNHYHFPKLRHISIRGECCIPPLDLLASWTTTLVTLTLWISDNSLTPTPTLSQLLSVLSSNPNLQSLALSSAMLPKFTSDKAPFQVQLPHLKSIHLSGDSRDGLELLHRLVPANKMDFTRLDFSCHSTLDISQTLARYLGVHILHRGDLHKGLAVSGSCGNYSYHILLGDVEEFGDTSPSHRNFMEVSMYWSMVEELWEDEYEEIFFNSLTYISCHIVCYHSSHSLLKLSTLSPAMPNLTEIFVELIMPLSQWFVGPESGGTRAYGELFPSLKYIKLSRPSTNGWDWSPLTTFLSCRANVGNQLKNLDVHYNHLCLDAVEEFKGLVQHVTFFSWHSVCPYGRCTAPSGESE